MKKMLQTRERFEHSANVDVFESILVGEMELAKAGEGLNIGEQWLDVCMLSSSRNSTRRSARALNKTICEPVCTKFLWYRSASPV